MPDSEFYSQIIDVCKTNGETIKSVAACVQDRIIFVRAKGVQIAAGDKIVHHTSIGTSITYSVVNPGFRDKALGVPATYRIQVQPA